METVAPNWIGSKSFWVITSNEIIYGIVSYYFEDEQSKWLELGIVIHESGNWNQGIGTRVLKLWIESLFILYQLQELG